MTQSARSPRRAQRGFSLIESLVSLLVFSLGVLALVSLQAASVQQSANAKYRSDASLLTNQLLGQMWVSDRTATTLQTKFNTGGSDYATWLADVEAALPGATVKAPTVAVDAEGQVLVNIYWKAPNELATAPTHQFTAIAQIK